MGSSSWDTRCIFGEFAKGDHISQADRLPNESWHIAMKASEMHMRIFAELNIKLHQRREDIVFGRSNVSIHLITPIKSGERQSNVLDKPKLDVLNRRGHLLLSCIAQRFTTRASSRSGALGEVTTFKLSWPLQVQIYQQNMLKAHSVQASSCEFWWGNTISRQLCRTAI